MTLPASSEHRSRFAIRVRRLLVPVSLTVALVLPAAAAEAADGDIYPEGQRYCADTYTAATYHQDHPSYFGTTPVEWVVDLNGPTDANNGPIIAPGPGTVTQVSHVGRSGYGNAVVWASSDGRERLHIAHLHSVTRTGAVHGGERIGTIGGTGWSHDEYGAHIHISRELDGAPAPVVLSGKRVTPYVDPELDGKPYGPLPPHCNSAVYTSVGAAGSAAQSGGVWHRWQASGGGWSAWTRFTGTLKAISVEENADGRLEVFGPGSDDTVWHRWQLSGGGWSPWTRFGGRVTDLDVGRNADGRLEVFGIGMS